MSLTLKTLSPGPTFWPQVARLLLEEVRADDAGALASRLVLVPTYTHITLLRDALTAEMGGSFIPPQIRTLDSWLEQQPPEINADAPATNAERLMALYASLRDIAWLKKLFAARRNTDLLPLAQTLLALCDELTAALLPAALAQPEVMDDRWQAALTQLSPRAAALLSEESRLVWNLWQGERDARDPGLLRYAAMQRAAAAAECPLLWCSPWVPDALESGFLQAWSQHQPVALVQLDWSSNAVPIAFARSWPELSESILNESKLGESKLGESNNFSEMIGLDDFNDFNDLSYLNEFTDFAGFSELTDEPQDLQETHAALALPAGLSLYAASGLEDEAQSAAQTIVDWIAEGKTRIAIVPQDRVVARRVRALLERAQVFVSDETGWKLSTTRAAAVVHAWLQLVAAGGDSTALLDFLKSPFIPHESLSDATQRNAMESALISAGAQAGWHGMLNALNDQPAAKTLIDVIAREAARYARHKTVHEWVRATHDVFEALGSTQAMLEDPAGEQVLAMLEQLSRDCESLDQRFSLNEWRALLDLQMEQTVFVASRDDQRVMMVPLNGSTLRHFDAAIVLGADSEHLPSRPAEALFFANAVRREMGLQTRESRQRQQLREFASLLMSCPVVVLSWQAHHQGETVAPSSWIQRLELTLESAGLSALPRHKPERSTLSLQALLPVRPSPVAPELLPASLSASGYNSLVACPYQFFASRMLGLRAPDEISELPEKRDYGDWLHQILKRYHDTVRAESTAHELRFALMTRISDEVFDDLLEHQPAALGYKARWIAKRDAYVEWANTHEKEGWQFAFGEQWQTRMLNWGEGKIKLHGQIDRVDQNADGESLVLDYKSSKKDKLSGRLRKHEDHQLPFYGLLLEPAPVRAAYVAIDDDKPGLSEANEFHEWRDALQTQLIHTLQAIQQGTALPASGVNKSCEWCDVRGLCRKGVW